MTATNTKTATKTRAAKATKAKAPAKVAAKTAKAKATAIKILDPKFVYGREGTVRRKSWDALVTQKGAKTRESYIANGGKAKYLPRWQKAGAIQIAA